MALWSDVAKAGVEAVANISTKAIEVAGDVKKAAINGAATFGSAINDWAGSSVSETKYRDYTTPIVLGLLIVMIGMAYIIKTSKK